MKHFLTALITMLLLFNQLSGNSQSVTLTYTGMEHPQMEYVQTDSILIRNITREVDTMLYWPDTTYSLLLVGSTEMQLKTKGFELIQNYPNPFKDQTTFGVHAFSNESLNIIVYNLTGQKITEYKGDFLAGIHLFSFSGNSDNFYIINVFNHEQTESIKLINNSAQKNTNYQIKYIGYQAEDNFKKTKQIKNKGSKFFLGDEMVFVGYADGFEQGAIFDSPTENSNYVFEYYGIDNFNCGDLFIDYRDNQAYETVQIGNQCWFSENLNIGYKISGTENQEQNSIIEKYCYDDNDENCNTYGGLYQWDELMQYDTSRFLKGLCPEGWHMPTIDDWNTLIDTTGGPAEAGEALKLGGYSGFNALMSGSRNSTGDFSGLQNESFFWTSVQKNNTLAYYNLLTLSADDIQSDFDDKMGGYSVRCIKGLPIITKPNIVTIDTTTYELVSDSTELSEGLYIYEYNSNRNADDIIINDVIIGLENYGYLRRVNSLSDDYPYLTLETSQGTMNDVFNEGEFELPMDLNDLSKSNLGYGEIEYLADGVALELTSNGFEYGFSDVIIYDNDILSIKITDGSVLFDPEFSFDFKFRRGVKRLAFYSDESLLENSINVELEAQYEGLVDTVIKLATYSYNIVFTVGPVPVVLVLKLELLAVPSMAVDADFLLTGGYTNTNYITIGSSYEDGTWNEIWNLEQDNNLHPTDFSGSINLTQKLSLIPKVSAMFYGVAGPYFNIDLWEQFLINMVFPSLDMNAEMNIGLNPNVGAEVTIFGNELASYNRSLPGFDHNIWNLPDELTIISGNNQTAQINQELPNPIKVKITDNFGNGFANIPVHFNITQGGGNISDDDVMTNSDGFAEVNWTMGNSTGTNTLTARVQKANGSDINGSPLQYTATATEGNQTATVTTANMTNITETTATGGGNVTDDGGSTVTARGVCWDISPNPNLSDNYTTNGSGTGVFTSNITGLSPNTLYYVRAYATNSEGIAYGNQVSFTTDEDFQLPSLTTTNISNITETTAQSGGNITDDGGASITERGVCWSTVANPNINNQHTSDGSGIGSFTSNITSLAPNTLYYVRAYATNTAGTTYGNQLTFTTNEEINLPTLTTTAITNITETTAQSGGNITDNGGASITERGVCWSTVANPNINNQHSSDGSGVGSFISNITSLAPNTLYYVRAYATNTAGSGYGNQVSFSTDEEVLTPIVTTTEATAVTATYAQTGGNIIDEGGSSVTVKGVCYDSSPSPNLSDDYTTTTGGGTGVYMSILTGLTPNTTYYVKAYATNSYGTEYGNQITFATSEATLPDADFTATPLEGVAPLAVSFTDISSNDPYIWFWEFGDGFTSFTQNPIHTYTDAGTYTVSFTATNVYVKILKLKPIILHWKLLREYLVLAYQRSLMKAKPIIQCK